MRPNAEILAQLVLRITTTVKPLRVVLFGSGARGTMSGGSDLDVLVVMPDGTHRRRTAQTLYEQIWDVPAPTDIVVVTESDLCAWKDNPSSVIQRALAEGAEGEVLYERAA